MVWGVMQLKAYMTSSSMLSNISPSLFILQPHLHFNHDRGPERVSARNGFGTVRKLGKAGRGINRHAGNDFENREMDGWHIDDRIRMLSVTCCCHIQDVTAIKSIQYPGDSGAGRGGELAGYFPLVKT